VWVHTEGWKLQLVINIPNKTGKLQLVINIPNKTGTMLVALHKIWSDKVKV